MRKEYINLKSEELLALFRERGISDARPTKKNISSINTIGYYKLKQYAYAFWSEEINQYVCLNFGDLVNRYYRDQALKQVIFQIITDIECALNVQIANVLGEEGPYEYLKFGTWCQRNSKNRYLHDQTMNKFKVKQEELRFLSNIQKKIRNSSFHDIEKYNFESSGVFPPVWLMVNALTMGESVHLIKLMSRKRRQSVASFFKMNEETLLSYLGMLNLVRNICFHNGNLVDLKVRRIPSLPNTYKKYLILNRHNLATVVCVLLEFMKAINPRHRVNALYSNLARVCDGQQRLVRKLGFKDFYSMKKVVFSFYEQRVIDFYPNGNVYVRETAKDHPDPIQT